MSEPVLRATRLAKSYGSGSTRIVVLRELDIDVAAGETVAVIGDSGVGKSTLLHILGGLDRPDSGKVLFDGREIFEQGNSFLATYRNRHVGFVFQFHHLLPEFNALENVEMPFRIGRVREGFRERAVSILEMLGLGGRLEHYPSALSGGEQQRVAIARAIARSPSVLMADEPTGNLDPGTSDEVFRSLRQLQRDERFGLVLATHSSRLAAGCDRVMRLAAGALRPLGDAEAAEYFRS